MQTKQAEEEIVNAFRKYDFWELEKLVQLGSYKNHHAIVLYSPHEEYECSFTTQGFNNLEDLILYINSTLFLFDVQNLHREDVMGLLKDARLFPHIRGAMIKDKPVTLHLGGSVDVVEAKMSDDWKAEINFTDHKKKVILGRNEVLKIIGVYKDEPRDWVGKPIVLKGKWYRGLKSWGVIVDEHATPKAYTKWKQNQPHAAPQNGAETEIAAQLEEDQELDIASQAQELPLDLPASSTNNYTEA